jgi:glycosyltransferase involved in cell wall biosynthesis
MRVIQVVTSVAAGGLARYVIDLMVNTPAAECQMHLVCTHFEGPHYEEARNAAASATVLGARRQLLKLARLIKLIRSIRPNAVHAHQEPIALIAARLAGVPVRVETIHLAKYWLNDGRPIVRAAARRCTTHHIVYSDDERSLISVHVDQKRVRVITPGLDPSRFKKYWTRAEVPLPGAAVIPDSAIVIGTIARLDEQKGVCHLLSAAPGILHSCPSALFLIVGDGNLRKQLEQQCIDLNIADKVIFAGYQLDAYRYLGVMDIFVMPSLFESWGFTAMEAMWAGVPLISTDIPGPREFVTPNETGLLVEPANPEAIAIGVARLASDRDLRHALAASAGEYVKQHYSVGGMVRKYLTLYSG